MSIYDDTQDHSSPFIKALKQSYRKSLARVHQATLHLHARQSSIGGRSYSEKIHRAVKHVKIFAIFTAGLLVAMVSVHGNENAPGHLLARSSQHMYYKTDRVLQAPWALAALEVAVMTALYVLLLPGTGRRSWRHIQEYHYRFKISLEDILVITYARFLAVLLAYLLGSGQRMMRSACTLCLVFPSSRPSSRIKVSDDQHPRAGHTLSQQSALQSLTSLF